MDSFIAGLKWTLFFKKKKKSVSTSFGKFETFDFIRKSEVRTTLKIHFEIEPPL